jgi:hypothetical protein
MQALERTTVGALALELTALCNQKCGYCYNGWREDAGKSVGSADGEQLLQRLRRLFGAWRVDHVTLTGGEPLLHPQPVRGARVVCGRERGCADHLERRHGERGDRKAVTGAACALRSGNAERARRRAA